MLGNGVLGILKEANSKWERRAPLTPAHCARLLRFGDVEKIIVQPCTKRIHRDCEFEDVGCEISSDLSCCGLILGVKQPENGTLLEDRAYGFFSHTHKAQPQNMPMLDEVLRKRIVLYDYELIVDDAGKRLVAFGEYAGRAGMIDFLRGLGERLLSLGFSTPFVSLGSSYMYLSLSAAKSAVLMLGDAISSSGLPQELCPLVFVFTGSGKVSQGAQEILKLLPHEYVDPSKLKDLAKERLSNRKVYASVVSAEHMVAPNDSYKFFNKADYYVHPEDYHSVFHETIAPYASVIVNCMYWEHRFPQLLTNQQLQNIFKQPCRLLGIADITCDVEGSVECLKATTTIEQPFFRYNPTSCSHHSDLDGDGIVVLGVDILPTEFAKEATKHFGNALYPFLGVMSRCQTLENASSPLRRACIAHSGHLTALFEYIQRIRASEDRLRNGSYESKTFRTKVSLSGHLFDKFLINEALDVIEAAGGNFQISACEIGQTSDAISYAELEVAADSEETLASIVNDLSMVAAHCTTQEQKPSEKSDDDATNDFHVLILGAGRMCEPAVTYLAGNNFETPSNPKAFVYVGSLYLEDALKATEGIANAAPSQVDVMDQQQLRSYIGKVAVVISLLPPSFHERVAEACIEMKKHLVTASYVSKEMDALNSRAQQAGITLLCEMGLDPGIDHMMAMKMIHAAHDRGGKVRTFESYCGGLPSPEAANNPLGYKFSWNPAGAIKAGRNSAVYKHEDEIVKVPGEGLFASALPFRIPQYPAYALEMLPNRDSLMYGELYGISEEAVTIFRATLRYQGFGEIMHTLGKLGYFNTSQHHLLASSEKRPSYQTVLKTLLLLHSSTEDPNADGLQVESFARLVCSSNSALAKRVLSCIRFLGLDSENVIPASCTSLFEVLCSRMEAELVFQEDEQDLVLLHHEVEITYEDSRPSEKQCATLVAVGDCHKNQNKPQTAMARTVGLAAAIGAQLLLTGQLKSKGVIRPLQPEIYIPALEQLGKLGLKLAEQVD